MKNVILFTIDTLRRDALGVYNGASDNTGSQTPFLDSLTQKSAVFTQAHSVAPYTQASFPGILTSSYIFDAPRAQKISPDRTIISQALKEKGIITAAFHSNPYLSGFFGWNKGWDHFYDSMEDDVDDISPYIKGNIINRKVDAWIKELNDGQKEKPLFLWVHYMDVHEPYVPERKYIDRIDPSIDLTDQQMYKLFQDVLLKRDISNPETVELFRKLYRAHVCEVDDYAREFLDILNSNGILEDSTVIITTDHGDEFGEHDSLSHDGRMYAELVHVPLIVYNPPEKAGERIDTLVSGIDMSPTVMGLLGLGAHPNFQGHSLFPVAGYPANGVYGEAIGKLSHKIKPTDKPACFYRGNGLKVIYREEDDRWELYDLDKDPEERKNLFATASAADEMKEKLEVMIRRKPMYT